MYGAFTKIVVLYAVGWSNTKAVLKVVLEKYILRYELMRKILTVQGKQFKNKEWH